MMRMVTTRENRAKNYQKCRLKCLRAAKRQNHSCFFLVYREIFAFLLCYFVF